MIPLLQRLGVLILTVMTPFGDSCAQADKSAEADALALEADADSEPGKPVAKAAGGDSSLSFEVAAARTSRRYGMDAETAHRVSIDGRRALALAPGEDTRARGAGEASSPPPFWPRSRADQARARAASRRLHLLLGPPFLSTAFCSSSRWANQSYASASMSRN